MQRTPREPFILHFVLVSEERVFVHSESPNRWKVVLCQSQMLKQVPNEGLFGVFEA